MKKVLVVLAVIGMVVSAIAAVTPEVKHILDPSGEKVEVVITDTIMGNTQLRLWCILGSIGGAVINAGFYRLTIREMVLKMVTSCIFAVCLTPWIMHIYHANFSIDYVLGYSAAIALVSWTVLQFLPVVIRKVAAKWLKDKTGIDVSTDEPK
jgi:hypothetical protein